MNEQLKKLLKALGFTDQQLTDLEAVKPDDATWKPDTLVEGVRTGIRNSLMNDNDFLNSIPEDKVPEATKKKIESGQYARFQNELIEVATKKLGLDEKETLTDEDRKSIKKMVEKIATGYLAKNNNTDGLKKMQTDYAEALQKLEAKDTEHQTKLTEAVNSAKGEGTGKIIKLLTRVQLGGLDKIKLVAPADYVVDGLLSKLNNKYSIVLEGDEIGLKQKANVALDVLDTHGKKISFGEALRTQVLEDKLGEEVKEQQGPDPKKKVIVNNDGSGGENIVAVPDYIKAAIEKNTPTPTT